VKSNKKWKAEYVKQNVHDPLNFQKGKEEGRQQEKIDMAKNMLADGMSVAIVSKYIDLSIEQLMKINGEAEI